MSGKGRDEGEEVRDEPEFQSHDEVFRVSRAVEVHRYVVYVFPFLSSRLVSILLFFSFPFASS